MRLEFASAACVWDADHDGVMDGVQHNTYDVEFFGQNPQCGIYYFGGRYRELFERGRSREEIAPALRGSMGSEKTEHPEVQVAEGGLIDQLVGSTWRV